jgi:hypothetical protein
MRSLVPEPPASTVVGHQTWVQYYISLDFHTKFLFLCLLYGVNLSPSLIRYVRKYLARLPVRYYLRDV